MEKINCNVIQDILPLYIDDVVSDDTKELVEEHLQNCEICQRVYHETKQRPPRKRRRQNRKIMKWRYEHE